MYDIKGKRLRSVECAGCGLLMDAECGMSTGRCGGSQGPLCLWADNDEPSR